MENKNRDRHSFKDVAKTAGSLLVQALARPHILSPVSDHFQNTMGRDLFIRQYYHSDGTQAVFNKEDFNEQLDD